MSDSNPRGGELRVGGCGTPHCVGARGLGYGVRVKGHITTARASVILIHGFAGSSDDWAATSVALAKAGFAAVSIDLPGHGRTDSPPDRARYSMAETACDLILVAAALGVARGHWLGYSMGGRMALQVALADPERVASLILESASPGIADEVGRAERRAEDEALAAEIESRGVAWFADHWETMPIFRSQRTLSPEVRDAQRNRRLRNRAPGLAASLRGLGQGSQEFFGPRLGSIACPTLFLTGALDSKYVAISERAANAIPGAERVVIPGAGHNIHLEQPEAFQQALLDRLRRLEPASRASASEPA